MCDTVLLTTSDFIATPPVALACAAVPVASRSHLSKAPLEPAKSKRGREEGDGTENGINCRDVCHKLSWHFMTTYDDLWRFMKFYVNGIKRRKLSQNVANCRDMSYIVVTFVANCRDIFFPVPFPPSPFGFRRLRHQPIACGPRNTFKLQDLEGKKHSIKEEPLDSLGGPAAILFMSCDSIFCFLLSSLSSRALDAISISGSVFPWRSDHCLWPSCLRSCIFGLPPWQRLCHLTPKRRWESSRRRTYSRNRARKRHINFEHINFLKVGTTLGHPTG